MRCVADASVVLAALVASDESHAWASSELMRADAIAAPHILHAEVANKLRRFARDGRLGEEEVTLTHADVLAMPIELFAYKVVATRAWELRFNVTSYDAWYVALAELLDVPLLTLDHRLSRAPGPRCQFITDG